MPGPSDTAAVILAGGRGRRMGGALKALLPLAGQPLLAHGLARLAPQIGSIAVSANDPAVGQAAPGRPLLADRHDDRRGPLAGILAGLAWAGHRDYRWLVSLPVDCPFLPADLVARLREQAVGVRVVIARSAGQAHPTAALWDISLHDDLARVLAAGTDLSVRRFYEAYPHAFCDFPGGKTDPFFNINRPEDLASAEDALAAGKNLEPIVAGDADQHHADGIGLPHGEKRGR
ncbi:molybdenum cofactor guanylyltransferase MobA [Acidisoma cellulosilytica]|uniref:Molybdenum cofactor guanylyltransferase n=1 Tax=Acidisoma cellulosilyticum TaxID=2802395 RepID=A0A964E675_9PROT|nr:molybdenum cofactor guanylyltransferase MobA [Acidisoma cellulosilyticum]MCB8883261.1 molybdenum cofactor guanylyltransferase MobA [Acidisoma cellulosilyticum]